MARAAARLRAAVLQADSPIERVEAWIRGVISAADDPRRVARARLFSTQQAVLRRFAVELDASVQLLLEPLRDAIAWGAATGAFPWADPARDAELIYALAGREMTTALDDRPDRRVAGIVSETTAFALRALGVAPN